MVRMDERQFRFVVQPGTRNAYVASGWEVASEAGFTQAVDKPARPWRGTRAWPAPTSCRQRRVQQMVCFADPAGNLHEVSWGFKSDFAHFASPVGVFALRHRRHWHGSHRAARACFAKTVAFFKDVMGFGLSEIMNFEPPGTEGVVLPIHFFHCSNGRHHSLAVAGFPVESGCVHVMVEVENMPEVGRAIDRMHAHKVQQTATLGQHTNDKMTSFYMRTPSNFDIEYGYGGAVIDLERARRA